jgi:succinyl-CoA synthetase beta subunit
MQLFEHQAKELFREAGIPVPEGRLVDGVSDLDETVREVGRAG